MVVSPTLPAATATAVVPTVSTPLPTATLLPPQPTPTAVPSVTPLPTATIMPKQAVVLSVPLAWQERAVAAVAQMASDSVWQWQVTTHLTATEPLVAEDVQVALVADGSGRVVSRTVTVLAVPFVTEWEETDISRAEMILAEGDRVATVMDWADMPATYKALRIDGRFPTDPDYPFKEVWSLVAAPGYETAVDELMAHLSMMKPLVHIAAVGDIMLDRGPGYVLQQGNLEYPFALVAEALRGADITVGNVESALGDVGEPAPKKYPFRAPPEAAEALALAGFDVVSLANNHGMDYGAEALLQAIDLLQAAGVAAVGAGGNEAEAHAPYVVTVEGVRIAFLGFVNVPVEASSGFDVAWWNAGAMTPGLAWAIPEVVAKDVRVALGRADLVVVVLHSGYEYIEEPGEEQMENARAAIDAGAHLVIGHHAHILQGVEFYKDGVIVYGLGNFAFEIEGAPETAILNVWLDGEGVRQLEFVPALIQFGGQPRLADVYEAEAIRQRVYYLTRLLNLGRW